MKFAAFPIPQILNFGALAWAPCDFSSFHQIASKSKTNAKSLKNGSQHQPKNLLKSRQKSIKNHIRFFIDFYFQNGAKMSPKWEGKKWANLALGTLGGQGGPQGAPKAPEDPQSPKNEPQRSPQTPKMDPKSGPETPKWRPSDPPSSHNGAQDAPRLAPKMCARSLHDRTNIRTNAKTTTRQPTKQTTKIKRPGGMREAIE